jgi:hypothetical protein
LAQGDVRPLLRRKAPSAERISARVAKFCACDAPVVPEGVQPLNPGFFRLERMRSAQVTKVRAAKRGKLKGK